MAPTTPAQQPFVDTTPLLDGSSTALDSAPMGALSASLGVVYADSKVRLYRLSTTGAAWVADNSRTAASCIFAAADDMVVAAFPASGGDDYLLVTPGSPWTEQTADLAGSASAAYELFVSADQAEVILSYGGTIYGYPTSPFSGTANWSCSAGSDLLVASPRLERWLSWDFSTTLTLRDDTGTSLDTETVSPDYGDLFDGALTWVALAADVLCYFYIHVPTTGSWPSKPCVIRYRVLTTTSDVLAWDDIEQEIDAGWVVPLSTDGMFVLASSWFGQVALAYLRVDNT